MRKNIYFSICMALIAVLVAVIPCFLDNGFLAIGQNLAIYLTVKIVFGIWLVVATFFILFKKFANTTGIILLSIAGAVQFVPLIVRYVLPLSLGVMWSIVISTIVLIVSVALLGLLMVSNKKMVESDKKFEGKTIEVKDDSKMFDENNHFTGIK